MLKQRHQSAVLGAMGYFKEDLLAGATAFCVGASSGINMMIAQAFADHGAAIFVVSRSPERVAKAVAAIGGERADGYAADVRDDAAISDAAARCRDRFGLFDIVLSGAAGNFLAPAAELSANGFRTVVDIDLIGGFNVMRNAYPHLRKPGASLISISALQSYVAFPGQVHACAAKAGLDATVRSLAYEWGPEGIRVNGIAPGPVADTEGMRRLAPDRATTERLTADIPIGRWANTEDIAHLALFLASGAAANITGTTIVSDGGYLAGRSFSGRADLSPAGV